MRQNTRGCYMQCASFGSLHHLATTGLRINKQINIFFPFAHRFICMYKNDCKVMISESSTPIGFCLVTKHYFKNPLKAVHTTEFQIMHL